MRWYVRDDFDEQPSLGAPVRIERIRELVDKLPPEERHLVERTFFGGESVAEAGREIGLEDKRAADVRRRAIARLRRQVLRDHALGALRPADS